MTPLDILTVVLAFVINSYPIAVAVGLLGHALAASKWSWVRRVGMVLEGIGMDWKRIAEAFKSAPKDGGK
jgi:hydrogenase/urease accessory protein HupE